jgi:hypothetical protein
MINLKSHFTSAFIVSLAVILSVWAIPYLLGDEIVKISSDLTYIVLTILLAITALFQVSQIHNGSKNKQVWIIFAVFAIAYSIAQHIWSMNELIFDQKPFPSFADIAFLIDTVCLIPFFILYIKSLKQNITKKIFAISTLPSFGIVLLSIYIYSMTNSTDTTMNQILLFSYPFLDSISLIPALIGITLGIKNKLNFPVFLICSSMIPLTIGDVLFQITSENGTNYSGGIPDLFFYIQINLLIFGIYHISNNNNKDLEKKI